MITIIIAICSVILSICSFIVALLNRLDNLRPQIYAILNTKKDQEGKRIKAENLEIKNFGKVPGIITNIKIICEENIYINNKQYKFESMFEAPDNKSSPDSCVKCYTMFLPFLLIKIDVFS
ncbi:hypothetical protein [Staphylococcus aureus]|uniref:hypothetical protein n=1 Tax=Staphylococcus aureus TaxID=1280 RepID=UPI001F05B0AE|nr:hypothetical protein [Staphylococcus aureus]